MFYHASPTAGIKVLKPAVSEHGMPLLYFSGKRENVLVYLSNAVEKYCRETGFRYEGKWQKWGPYGFDTDGLLQIQEYYPGALESTYGGVSGYIYAVENIADPGIDVEIPDVVTSRTPVAVDGSEYVPDAYEAILQAERDGLITIVRYEEMPEKMKEWLKRIIPEEYRNASDHPEYRHFLKGCFPDIIRNCGLF